MLPILSLVTLPSSNEFLDDVAEWSSPFFNDLLPIAIIAIAFPLAGLLIWFLIKSVVGSVKSLMTKSD